MKEGKGITLIALIITIIVMLILVAVTINVALNGGLFDNARNAAKDTQREADKEELLSAVVGTYDSITKTDLERELGTDKWEVADNGDGTLTCTKKATKNSFKVDKTTGKITETVEENNQQTAAEPQGPEEDNTPATYAKTSELTLGTNVRLVAYKDLAEGDIKTAVDSGKVCAVIEETVGEGQNAVTYTAVVPVGYTVSSTENENTITKGLVIYDGTSSNRNNEFVWIPVLESMTTATTSDTYIGATDGAEPKELTSTDSDTSSQAGGPFKYDSQDELDYYYGENYFTYPDDVSDENNVTDFSYGVHYKEMTQSVNKYGGFYVGRYETTIDGTSIGSKYNATVLTLNKLISGTYKYRWWGLYYAQRHANVVGNGSTVQTNMIWGQQWDKMIAYFDRQNISYEAIDTKNTYNKLSGVVLSGQATYTNKTQNTEISDIKDEIFNIYDLRANAYDWTADAGSTSSRVSRGGIYFTSESANNHRNISPENPVDYGRITPLTLYKVGLKTERIYRRLGELEFFERYFWDTFQKQVKYKTNKTM